MLGRSVATYESDQDRRELVIDHMQKRYVVLPLVATKARYLRVDYTVPMCRLKWLTDNNSIFADGHMPRKKCWCRNGTTKDNEIQKFALQCPKLNKYGCATDSFNCWIARVQFVYFIYLHLQTNASYDNCFASTNDDWNSHYSHKLQSLTSASWATGTSLADEFAMVADRFRTC